MARQSLMADFILLNRELLFSRHPYRSIPLNNLAVALWDVLERQAQ